MNPFENRAVRTILLFLIGVAASFAAAAVVAPLWPGFCDGAIVGAPCEAVGVQTAAGYLLIVLGILTIVFGPIIGSLLDLLINGSRWETPRGTENVITNMPLLVGAIYVLLGIAVAATA